MEVSRCIQDGSLRNETKLELEALSSNHHNHVPSMDLAFRHFRFQKRARFLDLLYPPEFQTSDDFDCLQPILTLSMFPEKLDLDQNGFWSQALRLWKRVV